MNTWLSVAIVVAVAFGLASFAKGLLFGTELKRGDSLDQLRLAFSTWTFGVGLIACLAVLLATIAILLAI